MNLEPDGGIDNFCTSCIGEWNIKKARNKDIELTDSFRKILYCPNGCRGALGERIITESYASMSIPSPWQRWKVNKLNEDIKQFESEIEKIEKEIIDIIGIDEFNKLN